MKTTLLTCILAITCGSAATAQVSRLKQQNPMPGATPSKLLTGNKTTGADSRLVGTAMYIFKQGSLSLVDSTQMYYSGKRSYDAKLGEWLYDNSKTFDDKYDESYRSNNTFDANDRLVQTLNYTFDGVWYIDGYIRYEYTPAGNMAAKVESRFDGAGWDSIRRVYTYNANGDILTDVNESYDFTAKAWIGVNRSARTYTPAGKEDTWSFAYYDKANSQWVTTFRATNTYNTAQQLTQSLTEEYFGGSWNNSSQTLFTYNTLGKLSTELYQVWNSIAFDDANRYSYVYNGDDLVSLTTEIKYTGSYLNSQQSTYLYNSQHQPTQETLKSWDNLNKQFVFKDYDRQVRFYYKDFSTGIATQTTRASSLRVYPVPAGNELNVDVHFATPEHGNVMLLDMTGSMVKQLNLPAATQHSQRIDVSSLPAGQYLAVLRAGGITTTERVIIAK